MNSKSSSQSSKQKTTSHYNDNPVEALRDIGRNTVNEFKKIGTGMFDQLFGTSDQSSVETPFQWRKESPLPQKKKQEVRLFNYTEYYERELVKKQIKELTEQIKREIQFIKKADAALINEVKDIEKISMESLPEKPGIYHIRFLEIVLSILRTLRAKIGESKTWLQALISRKKKRGSLFLARAKKQGTQYSLSQELQSARSVQ